MQPTLPLAFGMPGPFEMLIIAGVGLLIFGRRLPEVGKGLARSIVEFKKGLREVTDDMDTNAPSKPASNTPAQNASSSTSPPPVV